MDDDPSARATLAGMTTRLGSTLVLDGFDRAAR